MATDVNTSEKFIFLLLSILFTTNYVIGFNVLDVQDEKTCGSNDIYDILNFQCVACGKWETDEQVTYQKRHNDTSKHSCTCKTNYRELSRKDDIRLTCEKCPEESTRDKLNCSVCREGDCTRPCNQTEVIVDRDRSGLIVGRKCVNCEKGSHPNAEKTQCVPCLRDPLNINNTICPPCSNNGYEELVGECFQSSKLLPESGSLLYGMQFENGKTIDSKLLRSNLRRAAYKCRHLYSQVSCSVLINLCALQLLNREHSEKPCQIYAETLAHLKKISSKYTLPPIITTDNSILSAKEIPIRFSLKNNDPNSKLPLKILRYSINGSLLSAESATHSDLQLCSVSSNPFIFGSWCKKACKIRAKVLWDFRITEFYELFIEYSDEKKLKLVPIPVVINDPSKTTFTRRFFLVDNLSGVPKDGDKAQVVRYATSVTLSVQLQQDEDVGKIYLPILKIKYAEATIDDYTNDADINDISFEMYYWHDQGKIHEDTSVAISIFSALAVVCSAIQTWSWSKRTGRIVIDLFTLFKMVLYLCGNLSTAFLFVVYMVSLVRLMFYKEQSEPHMVAPTAEQEKSFLLYIILAFILKTINMIHIFYTQLTLDIFFVDWEQPRLLGQGDTAMPVSVWRNYFIAREWKKLQTFRKTNGVLNLLFLLLLLKVCRVENLALLKHSSTPSNDCEPYSKTFRFTIAVSFFFLIAFIQIIYFRLIHDNFIGDKITRFTDLCSISNVSVFILTHRHYGYYIHGRSVHGHADTDMKQFNEHLRREEDNLCSQRGLVPNTTLQSFAIFVTRDFRQQFDKIILPALQIELPAGRANLLLAVTNSFSNLGSLSEQFIIAYQTMNKFLSTFIDHALQDLDYVVRDRLLREKLLGVEFEEPIEKSFFYNDPEHSFSLILFYGHELDFLMWEILFVSLLDILAGDFILAILVVIIVSLALQTACRNRSQWNVAKKSLLDRRFLI